LLDAEEWEGLRASLDFMMRRPGSHAWWKSNASLFNSSFREFMEDRYNAMSAAHDQRKIQQ
ncbi:MAG TPA: hypothetical protein VGD27_11155, partial [Longimicrobiales bacterium]